MQEAELVRLSREGNKEAFSALVAMYNTKVFSLAYGFTRDRAAADDLSQDIFIKAWRSLPAFREDSGFGTWLYRIAANRIKDEFRKRKHERRDVSLDEIGEQPGALQSDFDQAEKERHEEKRRALVHRALESLSPKHRIIMTLRDIQGLSYDEISDILKLPSGTVESRLHRARKKLRERLSPFLGEEGGRHEMS